MAETIAVGGERIRIRRSVGLSFDSGWDLPLLRAFRRIGYGECPGLPDDAALTANLLLRTGAFGRCHVLDVEPDDPLNFRFLHYGSDAAIGRGASRRPRIRDHASPALRQYACAEYARIRSTGLPDLAEMEVHLAGTQTVYRRMILPFGNGRTVTRLLTVFVPDIGETGSA